MTSIDALADVIRDRFPSAQVSLTHFPSGCVSLDVILHDKLSVLDYRPSEGYGLSLDVQENEGFLGHDLGDPDLSSAAALLLKALDAHSEMGEPRRIDASVDMTSTRRRVS